MFSTLFGTYLLLQIHIKMSSAICFNLDLSKILLSGNGLKEKPCWGMGNIKSRSITLGRRLNHFAVNKCHNLVLGVAPLRDCFRVVVIKSSSI